MASLHEDVLCHILVRSQLNWHILYLNRKHAATACQDRNVRYDSFESVRRETDI